ncbi:hypothetical protein [Sporolactobacillus sp. KGMB 08714]|uniref:hypothetical protein n=1 Tax=Sporolactobacillus sp. KGMB 08714 TaxID=3064704 RepID=UPI002FBDA226
MEKTGDSLNRQADSEPSSFVERFFTRFLKPKDVSTVFGETIDAGKKQIVPVARVRYMGGGGGGTAARKDDLPTDRGGGGGGYLSVKPLGFYEITEEKTTFKPAVDINFFILIATIFTLGLALIIKKSIKK